MVTHKFEVHKVLQDHDEVVGVFEVHDNEIVFPSHADKHHCTGMFPEGLMSAYTKNRITDLLDNEEKTTYLKKVK